MRSSVDGSIPVGRLDGYDAVTLGFNVLRGFQLMYLGILPPMGWPVCLWRHTIVNVLRLRVSPRDLIFLVGHSRLKPRSVFLMLYTSSAYSTLTPSAVSHMPSRNFIMRLCVVFLCVWLYSETELV